MIALTRARYSRNFVDQLQRLTGSIGPVLQKAELTEDLIQQENAFTTIHQLDVVAETSAYQSGNLEIGWDAAANVDLSKYGSFSDSLFARISLLEKLREFCNSAAAEYSSALFKLEQRRGVIHFVRDPIVGSPIAARQTELYVLVMMLATIRSVAGSKWQPNYVALQTFRSDEIESKFDPAVTELRFEQPRTIIEIDKKTLIGSVDMDLGIPAERRESDLVGDTTGAIGELFSSYLGIKRLNLELVAKIGGVHPRTLQRQLCREGTSFGDIIRRERFRHSTRLLRETDCSLSEISSTLGYSNQAHFCRAFRQISGVTPGVFRKNPNH